MTTNTKIEYQTTLNFTPYSKAITRGAKRWGRFLPSLSRLILGHLSCRNIISTVQCSAVQCSAVQCSAVQCSAVQCSAVQCSAVQCSAVQCSAVQCSAVQYSIVVLYINTVQYSKDKPTVSFMYFCKALLGHHGHRPQDQ